MTKTAELWRNEAQAGLEKVAIDHKALSSDGGSDRLAEYWNSLSSETKNTLINSILGGVVGGGAMGAMGAAAAPAGEGLHKGINSGIVGAILGALTGGAGTAAYNAVSSGRVLPGEVRGHRALSDTVADKVIGGAASNIGLTAGTIGGGIMTGSAAHKLAKNSPKITEALEKFAPGNKIEPLLKAFGVAGYQPVKLLGLPAGMGLGYLADKYIKGDYE